MATARLSDCVTYAYCSGCGHLLISERQARFSSERPNTEAAIWHSWCAVAETWTARQGQRDRRN